ncbi:MAG: AAA family ATPase, partial [Lysobacter sp.]|nr:AAA family ATPase [Lysobacter sp.]
MYGGKTDETAGELAHFRTDSGEEFDSDIRVPGAGGSGRLRKRLGAYFAGIGAKPDDIIFVTPEAEGGYRIFRKAGAGSAASAAIPVVAAFVKEISSTQAAMSPVPLNQILFGPPGTGKTYHSIDAALAVLDPDWLAANLGPTGRKALKQRFDELLQARRIRFVTFHQSFSYEDFVEGLRADNDEDGNLRYRVEPGVFKSLCDDARGAAQVASAVGIRDGARIWKISIEGTGASVTRDYGFKHGQARIGWGEVGDLHDEHLADHPEYQKLGSNDRNTLHAFSSEIQPGDVMLCIGSATQAQAIGVVQGDYRFEATVPAGVRTDFNNVLPVRWLATGLTLNLRGLNGGIRFTLKTVYELSRFGWPELAEAIEAADIKLGGATGTPARQPLDHVLIIDEINRGNVSRIFGELITLIEASKRAGADEQLEVVLPYSKKSFAVPANVYLIGTMNTADRSLMGLDIALRRRFEFVEMPARPGLLAGVVVDGIDIEAMLTVMNQRIEVLLDRDHHLGHAYFMPLKSDRTLARLAQIFRSQILPLLQEYFFEDWERIRWVLNDQHKGTD